MNSEKAWVDLCDTIDSVGVDYALAEDDFNSTKEVLRVAANAYALTLLDELQTYLTDAARRSSRSGSDYPYGGESGIDVPWLINLFRKERIKGG
ncbi:hypothetical protein LCGC14_0311210 [marine sediment metagenome]|uniref:Uncharacterized protein n=1 Tax=marine sediment metagenome TaxID=412755 RepID=A0A0F9WTZ3_9ZZZZ